MTTQAWLSSRSTLQVRVGADPSFSPASYDKTEAGAVEAALAAEVLGMQHTVGGEADFAAAAKHWGNAMAAATATAQALAGSSPVASKNASARAYAYWFRKGVDEQVASGQKPHPVASGEIDNPNYGWSWPPIPQDPVPPVFKIPPSAPHPPLPQPPLPGPVVPPPLPEPPSVPGPEEGTSALPWVAGAVVVAGLLAKFVFKVV